MWQHKQTPQSSLNNAGTAKTAPEKGGLTSGSMAPPLPSHSDTQSAAGPGGTTNSWKLQAVAKTSSQNIGPSQSGLNNNGGGMASHQHQSADEAVKGASAGSKNYRQLSRDIAIIDGMVTPTLNNKYKLFGNPTASGGEQ